MKNTIWMVMVLVLVLVSGLSANSGFASSFGSTTALVEGMSSTVESLVKTVLCPFESTTKITSDSNRELAVRLAQEDAKNYVLGADMTLVLEQAIAGVRDAADEIDRQDVVAMSNLELAREIYVYGLTAHE